MVDGTIVNFIKQHIAQGYDIKQIREYLLKYGFTRNKIDEAIEYIYKEQKKAQAAQEMQIMNRLQQYAKQQLAKGYNVESIRNYLLQSGYAMNVVDRAMERLAAPRQRIRQIIEVSPKTFAIVLVLLLVAAGLGFGAYKLFAGIGRMPQLIDYAIKIEQTDIMPGQTLYFRNTFVNVGAETEKEYDIIIKYKVINKETYETYTEWSETFAIDDAADKLIELEIPLDMPAGRYRLEGIISYNGKTISASNSFKVLSIAAEASCFDNLRNQGETGVDCGGICQACETCHDGIQNQNEEGVDCGGKCQQCPSCSDSIQNQGELGIDCEGPCPVSCEEKADEKKEAYTMPSIAGETAVDHLIRAKGLAKTQPDSAAAECSKITTANTKDECLKDVAELAGNPEICGMITNTAKADSCYLRFVISENRFELCPMITNEDYKASCSALASNIGITEKYSGMTLEEIQEAEETQAYAAEEGSEIAAGAETDAGAETLDEEAGKEEQANGIPSQETVEIVQAIGISNVKAIKKDMLTYIIKWNTLVQANSIVKYGLAPEYLTKSKTDDMKTTEHSITIGNLLLDKTYYYMAVSEDEYGNYDESEVGSFQTKI